MIKKILLVALFTLLFSGLIAAQNTTNGDSTVSAKSKSTKAPIFRPTKDQISEVQAILVEKGLYKGTPSGKYDTETRNGIKSFQKENGLKQTGTLNRATLEKFGVTLTEKQMEIPVSPNSYETVKTEKKPASEKAKRAAPFRADKDQIMATQKILKEGGMYAGEETGKLDAATRAGLKKFQEANGMKVTGTLNAATLEKLGVPLNEKQKALAQGAKEN